jgi:hypothetical protein
MDGTYCSCFLLDDRKYGLKDFNDIRMSLLIVTSILFIDCSAETHLLFLAAASEPFNTSLYSYIPQ